MSTEQNPEQEINWRKWGLNIGLIAAALFAVLLCYALMGRFFTPRVDPNRVSNPLSLMNPKITVEIRNATKQEGIAGKVRNYLFDRGFDVIASGNADKLDEAYTMVYDRAGSIEHARMIASTLGIPESRVQTALRPADLVDVAVILGKDYPALRPFKP